VGCTRVCPTPARPNANRTYASFAGEQIRLGDASNGARRTYGRVAASTTSCRTTRSTPGSSARTSSSVARNGVDTPAELKLTYSPGQINHEVDTVRFPQDLRDRMILLP
jgi:hypothetical protein